MCQGDCGCRANLITLSASDIEALAAAIDSGVTRVRRTNGAEGIDFGNGFRVVNTNARPPSLKLG